MNNNKKDYLIEPKEHMIYELSHAAGKEQLIFSYDTMQKPIIEIAFEASCSNEDVVAFLKVDDESLRIASQGFRSYLIRVVLVKEHPTVNVIFEKQEHGTGSLYLKNIKIQFLAQFPKTNSNISYVAHRGFSKLCPENTMLSFYKAAKLGFNKVETDVVTTSDGEWVLLHDDTIDRTSNGGGKITEMTLAEVRCYDFGSYKGAQFNHTLIPTFEEFIQFCQMNQIHPYIELKKASDITKIYKLVKVVEYYSVPVTWISFSLEHLEAVSALTNRSHRYGFLGCVSLEMIKWVKTLGENVFIDADKLFLSKTQIDEALKQGVFVEAWTVNELETAKHLISLGVIGITSDCLNLSGCHW